MKKVMSTLLVVMMTICLFVPVLSAVDIDTLDYSVSTTRVSMTAEGSGSFFITVPASTTPYAGVQFKVQLPDGVSITKVSYSLSGVLAIPPQISPNDPATDIYYFSCSSSNAENKYTDDLKCTIDIKYNGTSEKDLTILLIKQYRINGHNTIDLVSDKTAIVTLVPFLSSDATLKELTLSTGMLSPAFGSEIPSYRVTVPNSMSSISVTAAPNFAGANVVFTDADDNVITNPIALNIGTNEIRITVTAEDGTNKTYTITVVRFSSDATLKTLTINDGATFLAFDPETTDYKVTVPNSMSSINITAEPNFADANVEFTDADNNVLTNPIALQVGENVVIITVTAEDGSKNTYTVTVTRLSSDATLKALTINDGTPSLAFGPETLIYKVTVPNSMSSISVTAAPNFVGANVVFTDADDNVITNPIALQVGENVVRITVTAEDGTSNVYIIFVTREQRSASSGREPTLPSTEINEQETPTAAAFPFIDVNEGDWFYGDVYYSWLNGLVKGISDTEFSPNGDITRGMVVTILYRREGEPAIEGLANPFSDVAEDTWYTNAIKWAADKGIVLGYTDGTYKPTRSISRQEMAAILYRYSDYAEIELPKIREYQVFNDSADIAGYAQDAVKALFMTEIIKGKPENMFDPNGTATRAEFVAMIHRLIATIET